jgi:hypothetical protein
MTIDFHIAAPDEPTARAVAKAAAKLSYHTSVSKDASRDQWTTTCTTRMVLTLDTLAAIESELQALAKPLGAWTDGWGTFGNVPPP